MADLNAKRCASIAELRSERVAGSIELARFGDAPVTSLDQVAGIRFICPCGCGNESWLPTNRKDTSGPFWDLSGTVEAPTVRPSVFNTGMPCRWHGWLTDGVWMSC